MAENSLDKSISADLSTFVDSQKGDPAVLEVGLIGSAASGKKQPNDLDIYEIRTDIKRNELWVNASTSRQSGIQFDIFAIPVHPDPTQIGSFVN